MSIAIITGSTGFRSETSKFLLHKGFKVIGIDNNERKSYLALMVIPQE